MCRGPHLNFPHFLLAFVGSLSLGWFLIASAQDRPKLNVEQVRKTKSYKVMSGKDTVPVRTLNEVYLDSPAEFIQAVLVLLTHDKVPFIELQAKGVHLLLLGHHDDARSELVKYLSCYPDGSLEKWRDPEEPDERSSVAITAHYLLRLVDSVAECPYQLDVPKEWKRRTYGQVLQEYKKDVPRELIEYLFEEFPCEAWEEFRRHEWAVYNSDSTRFTLQEVELTNHLVETTAWRMQRGHRQFAEIKLTRDHLQRLANDGAWYSRRYVVHVLLKYPFLRTPELVKQLHADEHPLVRDRAKFIPFTDR
jgi:hypothetical protein